MIYPQSLARSIRDDSIELEIKVNEISFASNANNKYALANALHYSRQMVIDLTALIAKLERIERDEKEAAK